MPAHEYNGTVVPAHTIVLTYTWQGGALSILGPDIGTDMCMCDTQVCDEDVTACFSCNVNFAWNRRKHHCRVCGYVFCRPCCDYHMRLPNYEEDVRVCVMCAPKVTARR